MKEMDIMKCVRCGAENQAGALFCESCGSSLTEASTQAQQPLAAPSQPQRDLLPTIPGHFVVLPGGATLPVPPGKGEIVIGREDPDSGIFPDIDLDAHDALNQGVSRSHARMTIQGGQVYVEDLKTANFTNLRGQRLTPGQKYPLNNGDELILGRLRLIYHNS
jgi:pSer/pThr/pTyr-binding forkhead associated (FHA) protein